MWYPIKNFFFRCYSVLKTGVLDEKKNLLPLYPTRPRILARLAALRVIVTHHKVDLDLHTAVLERKHQPDILLSLVLMYPSKYERRN